MQWGDQNAKAIVGSTNCGIFRTDRCRSSRDGFDCSLSRCCSCYGLLSHEDRQRHICHPLLYIGQACCDLNQVTFFERIKSQHQASHHATLGIVAFLPMSLASRDLGLSHAATALARSQTDVAGKPKHTSHSHHLKPPDIPFA